MVDSNKVNIKLELSRDKNTGKLSLLVRFDASAPNVIVEKDTYAWLPTVEETELINEAFGIFSDKKTSTPLPSPEKIIEKHLEKPMSTELPDKKKDVGKGEKFKEDGGKIAEVGNNSVEDAIKRHLKEEDDLLKEADEHTIIDKVLSQKKKGKWKKI